MYNQQMKTGFAQTVETETTADNLNGVVNGCLKQYFEDLNGMSPTKGMYDKVINQVEKPLLENVLRYVRGNQVRAASILGINRNTLRKKINMLEINLPHLLEE